MIISDSYFAHKYLGMWVKPLMEVGYPCFRVRDKVFDTRVSLRYNLYLVQNLFLISYILLSSAFSCAKIAVKSDSTEQKGRFAHSHSCAQALPVSLCSLSSIIKIQMITELISNQSKLRKHSNHFLKWSKKYFRHSNPHSSMNLYLILPKSIMHKTALLCMMEGSK